MGGTVDYAAGDIDVNVTMNNANAEGPREWAAAASELVDSVNSDQPVNEVIASIAAHALNLLELDMCAVMLVDARQERLLVAGSAGLSDEYIRQLHVEHPLTVDRTGTTVASPSVQAFVSGRTVMVPDIESASAMTPWRELALVEGYAALIATPLTEGDVVTGVLVGYSRVRREFTNDQVELLAMFAVHAGATVRAAHRRDELQVAVTELNSANEALRKQSRRLETLDRHHRRLMQVMANDVGVSGVVTMLAELLDCSVTVEDPYGAVITSASHGTYVAPPHRSDRTEPVLAAALERVYAARSGSAAVPSGTSGGVRFWVAPVTLHNEVVALLWVGRPGLRLDDTGRLGIERFALAVALEMSKQRNAMQVRLRLSRDIISDLLTTIAPRDRGVLLERATALGHRLDLPHVVVVARPDARASTGQESRHSIVDVADAAVRVRVPGALVGGSAGYAVILLPVEDGGDSAAPEVAERIVSEYRRRNQGATASVMIGAAVPNLDEIARAFRVGRGALELAMVRRHDSVSDIGKVGVASLLLSHGDPTALEEYADRMFAPLDALDPRRTEELLQTLMTWLEEDRSTHRVAERLMVHVNTVTYRLKSVEEVLGRSLRDPSFLVDLQMALILRRISAGPDAPWTAR